MMSSKGFFLLCFFFIFTNIASAVNKKKLKASNKNILQAFFKYKPNLLDFFGFKLQEKQRFSIHSLLEQPLHKQEKSHDIIKRSPGYSPSSAHVSSNLLVNMPASRKKRITVVSSNLNNKIGGRNLPPRLNKSINGGRVVIKDALQGLYSNRGGKMLRISSGGRIKGVTRKNIDLHCVFLFLSVDKKTDIIIKIKGKISRFFIAMNANGRLYTTTNFSDPNTNFAHKYSTTEGDAFLSRHGTYLAFKGNGKPYHRKVKSIHDRKVRFLKTNLKTYKPDIESLKINKKARTKSKKTRKRNRKKCKEKRAERQCRKRIRNKIISKKQLNRSRNNRSVMSN